MKTKKILLVCGLLVNFGFDVALSSDITAGYEVSNDISDTYKAVDHALFEHFSKCNIKETFLGNKKYLGSIKEISKAFHKFVANTDEFSTDKDYGEGCVTFGCDFKSMTFTRSNMNAIALYTFLYQIKRLDGSLTDLNFDFLKSVKTRILNTLNSNDNGIENTVDASIKDINMYMEKLNLYNMLTSSVEDGKINIEEIFSAGNKENISEIKVDFEKLYDSIMTQQTNDIKIIEEKITDNVIDHEPEIISGFVKESEKNKYQICKEDFQITNEGMIEHKKLDQEPKFASDLSIVSNEEINIPLMKKATPILVMNRVHKVSFINKNAISEDQIRMRIDKTKQLEIDQKEVQKKLKEQAEKLQSFEETIKMYKEKKEELEKKIETLEEEKIKDKDILSKLKIAEDKIKELTTKEEAANKEIQEAQTKYNQLKKENEETNKKLTEVMKTLNDNKDTADRCNAEIKRLQEQIQKNENNNKGLEKIKNNLEEENKNAKNSIQELKTEIERNKQKLKDQETQLETIEKLKNEKAALEKEVETLKNQINSYSKDKEEIEKRRKDLESKHKEFEDIKNQIEMYKKAEKDKEATIQKKLKAQDENTETSELRSKIKNLNNELKKKDEEITKLKKDLKGIEERISEYEKQITEDNTKYQDLNKLYTDLQSEYNSYKNKYTITGSEIEELQNKYNDKIKEISTASNINGAADQVKLVQRLQGEISTLTNENEQKGLELKELRKQNKERETKESQSAQKINELEEKQKVDQKENKSLKDSIAKQEKEITNLTRRIEELKKETDEKQGRNQELEKALKEAKSKKSIDEASIDELIEVITTKYQALNSSNETNKDYYTKKIINIEPSTLDKIKKLEADLKERDEKLNHHQTNEYKEKIVQEMATTGKIEILNQNDTIDVMIDSLEQAIKKRTTLQENNDNTNITIDNTKAQKAGESLISIMKKILVCTKMNEKVIQTLTYAYEEKGRFFGTTYTPLTFK